MFWCQIILRERRKNKYIGFSYVNGFMNVIYGSMVTSDIFCFLIYMYKKNLRLRLASVTKSERRLFSGLQLLKKNKFNHLWVVTRCVGAKLLLTTGWVVLLQVSFKGTWSFLWLSVIFALRKFVQFLTWISNALLGSEFLFNKNSYFKNVWGRVFLCFFETLWNILSLLANFFSKTFFTDLKKKGVSIETPPTPVCFTTLSTAFEIVSGGIFDPYFWFLCFL